MHIALLNALLVMAAQVAQTGAQPAVVLACNIPANPAKAAAAAAPPAERVFRIAPGSLQEWGAAQQRFGQNLCLAYACARSPTRVEGSISTATVSYTVGIDYSTHSGYWRAAGASGLKTTEGSCRIVPAPTPGEP
jgi:hypothetical protein